MLTFILLVVIGGGAGLWVVSMAESSKPATDGSHSSRGAVRDLLARFRPEPDPTTRSESSGEEPEPEPHEEDGDEEGDEDVDGEVDGVDPPADPARETMPGYVTVPAAAGEEHEDEAPGDSRRTLRQDRARSGGRVSKAYTAIEGRYADVAHVPLWRRLLSLLGILAILAVLGVGIAAVLGAAFAAVGEVFNNTIG